MPGAINILQLIKSLGRGGAETLLPEALKRHNRQTFVFHYIYFLPWKNQLVEALEQAGGTVTCIPAGSSLHMLLKVNDIIRYCRQHDIRLIHCHLPWAGIIGRLVHKRTGLPVIYTEHNKQERYHVVTRWANRLTFTWQTSVVAVSADVQDSIRRTINPGIPVQTILNGVNTGYFQRSGEEGSALRTRLGIPADAVVVGTVAVFRFQKRLEAWLEVFKKASENNPRLYGIMAGDGPLRNNLMKLRKSLGLEQRLIMPGLQADVKPWYSAMDIFMMTSVFEGLPVALLEAMSMKCAVVTTDAGGIKEVVRNEEDGLVVPVEQWAELVDKITQLVSNENQRIALGEAARKRVIDRFSLTRMVTELENLYLQMV